MQIGTICFRDLDSGGEAVAVVRVEDGIAALALSLKQSGDIEVFFGKKELDQLIEALQEARAELSQG